MLNFLALPDGFNQTATYTWGYTATLLLLIMAGVFALILLATQDTTVTLLTEMFQKLRYLRLLDRAKGKHVILVIDSVKNRPVAGVEIALLTDGQIVSQMHTDSSGQVNWAWPDDSKATIRITRRGYRAVTQTVGNYTSTIELDPLGPETEVSWLLHLKRWIAKAYTVCLIFGTVLLVPLIFMPVIDSLLIIIIGYLSLWVFYWQLHTRPFYLARIMNPYTNRPIPYAKATLHLASGTIHALSDNDGYLRLPAPLPKSLTLTRKGFAPLVKYTIPAAAVSSDILFLTMQPAKE